MHYDLIILGAGAAGMMAAVAAAEAAASPIPRNPVTPQPRNIRIAIFEKNVQPGIKVLVCGGGRCNLTNAGSVEFLIEQFGRNGRFLTPALHHMDNDGLRAWFANQGVPTHEEHDGKIYPNSNQARSVVDALVRRMRELGVDIYAGPGSAAQTITHDPASHKSQIANHKFTLVTTDARTFIATKLILAVGGQSYTRMGTTGDGYTIAAALGHAIVKPRPAIVALLCKEEWPKTLQGLAVNDVEVRIEISGPLPRLATGKPTPTTNDMLFTHFGLSGPAVLNPSEIVAELLEKFPTVTLRIDFVRHHTVDDLATLLRRWQQQHGKKLIKTMLAEIIPQRLAEKFCELLSISFEQTCANLTSAQIHQLIERLKVSRFTIYDTRGFKEAMVTAGGVALTEVNPNTLESKLVPGLYMVGEVLDLTGPSGGYNLQLAFSTGHLAGESAAAALRG
jgi:predicted Rossmann fold flavoprotein